jgi:hypothetical protein
LARIEFLLQDGLELRGVSALPTMITIDMGFWPFSMARCNLRPSHPALLVRQHEA